MEKNYHQKIQLFSSLILSFISVFCFSQTPAPKFHDTKGNIEVTGAGQLQYTLAIDLPPGVKNTAPGVGLVYVSGAGNGLAGYGWNLTGLSAISRVGRNLEKDGITKGVQLDYSDYYSFNGQRLILKSGKYGKSGAEYVTEKYSNFKIRSVGSISGQSWQGPEYWEVTSPDGSQVWYGATASGSSNARTPIDYNIVKSKDPDGNYITYNYISEGNISVVSNIQWGGNETQGLQHFNKIDFIFTARPKSETAYIRGVEYKQTKLLESVVVSTGGQQYKKYNISYKKDVQGTSYRYPEKITISNGKNEEANPVVFTYEKSGEPDFLLSTVSTALKPKKDNDVVGDFDGDGNLDLLRYHSSTSSRIPQPGVYLYKNFYSVTYTTENPIFISSTLQGLKNFIAFNSKSTNLIHNKQGIVGFKAITNTGASTKDLQFSFYSFSGNSLVLDFTKTIPGTDYDNSTGSQFNGVVTTVTGINSVDFNGDGLSELVIALNDKECHPTVIGNPDLTGKPPQTCTTSKRYYVIDPDESIQGNGWYYSLELYPDYNQLDKDVFTIYKGGDFDGDGVFDLLKLSQDLKPVLITFKKNTQGQYESFIAPFNPANNEILQGVWAKGVVGDINGDGLSDLMIPESNTSEYWHKYISKGNGFNYEKVLFKAPTERELEQHGAYFRIHNPRTFTAYDINNDGKAEVIAVKSIRNYSLASVQDNNNAAKYVTSIDIMTAIYSDTGGYATTENQFSHGVYLYSLDPYTLYLDSNAINAEVGVNSRDLIGLPVDQWTGAMLRKVAMGSALGYGSDIGDRQRLISHEYYDIAKAGRIKSISQGGITTDIVYKQLDKSINPGLYDNVSQLSYPFVEINQSIGMYVVSQLTQSTTSDKKLKQDFRYRGLTSNILGRGLTGFRKTARSSWYAEEFENTKIWSGVETDPLNDGIPVKEWSIRTNNEANIFPPDLSENNTQLLSLKSTTYQIDKILNGQVVASVSDADKAKVVTAILPKTSRVKDFLTGAVTENNITYGAYYLPVQSVSKVNTTLGITASGYEYEHNPSGSAAAYYIGRLKSKTETRQAYGDSQSGKEEYTYENNRVKTLKKWNRNNTGYIQESYSYDGFGNITGETLSNSIDSQVRMTGSQYDPTGRFIIKKTDHLGLETKFSYNSWGQLTGQTDPLGNTLTSTYDNWGKRLTSESSLQGTTSYTYERDHLDNVTVTRNEPDGNISKTFTNKLGQVYKVSAKAFSQGQYVSQETQYDILGRKIKESEPYFEGQSASKWNTIAYDDSVYPAKVKVTAFTGKQTETVVSGFTTTVKETNIADYGRTTSKTADALGNMISSTDKGGTVQFSYNAAGEQIKAQYAENTVTTAYDVWGRKSEFNDPSNGLYKYEYDGFGQPKKTTSPKGTKEYTYNNMGQLVSQKELSTTDGGQATNKTIAFTYDTKGRLTTKSGTVKGQLFSTGITYDPQGRIISAVENSNERTYTQKGMTYDNKGRMISYEKELLSLGITTKVVIENLYSTWSGELYQVKDKSSGKVLWELQETNAKGQVLKSRLGAAEITNAYDANGFLSSVNHSSQVKPGILQISYSFDAIRNELKTRTTGGDLNIAESFDYDDNNRLINWTNPVTGIKPAMNRNIYDIKGRIMENDQVGIMKYENAAKIYQPTGMTLNTDGVQNYNGDLIQSITYNENNDPVQINGEKARINFEYGLGSMRQRVNIAKLKNAGAGTELKTGGGGIWDPNAPVWQNTLTKLYSEDGSFEVVTDLGTGQEHHLLYIGGTPYEADIVYLKEAGQSSGSYKFLHKDYIGSVLAISDEAGNKLEQRHYDAWGSLTALAFGNNGVVITNKNLIAEASLLIDRGYTSHEHFMDVGIIHMNGRLYDPLLRRFLNADENIQDPMNTQNYNKYGYVMNNPLMYNDPDGEFWLMLGGALLGGYFNGVAANGGNWNPVKWDWQRTWSAVLGGAIGGAAISGALGTISSNPGAIKFVLPGIISGGLNSAFTGSNFLGGAIGGISYSGNLFTNNVTSTDGISTAYKYIISPDYNESGLGDFVNDVCPKCPKNAKNGDIFTEKTHSMFDKQYWSWEHFGKVGKTYTYFGGEWNEIKFITGDIPIGPSGSFNILKSFKSALSLFKGGGFLTNAGRAVTKHPQYFGFESTEALMKVYRSPQALNKLGAATIKDVLRNGVKTSGAGGRYPDGWVTFTLSNGSAASWTADGIFIGFRGLK
ncbi:type IV secretion protein Rhs [Chryseobacterium sp. MEBOG06]|uniref:RHS repeat-associated core domain-containing protein n=1 Tax=Chryseobacterium sp. MEBOG06 TaxID=2879938 RepID=UPI001F2810D1|nr:RHS repeat-associated core domain-containing protein [Chryseobacterium sp. MEBOG06]UKB85668.1 type IV secretion protein Rhs [Chryseobacterium sp. MEBOG06]